MNNIGNASCGLGARKMADLKLADLKMTDQIVRKMGEMKYWQQR